MTISECVERFGFGCNGDIAECVARIPNGTGCIGGKSWTQQDEQTHNEGKSIAFMGRIWACTKAEALAPEAALAE